jgi:hypothetical protein
MNVHKNARLTPIGRERIVRQVVSGHPDQTLHSENQWQSRALHPDLPARVGLADTFVEADGEAARLRPDQIDLHDESIAVPDGELAMTFRISAVAVCC